MIRFLIRYFFRRDPEFVVFLGSRDQIGSLIAIIQLENIWRQETFSKKLGSLCRLNWIPTEELLKIAGYKTFMNSIFGESSDYGIELYKIITWHHCQKWEFDSLTENDIQKAKALQNMTVLARMQHKKMTSEYLHLSLAKRAPEMCVLLHPMVIKMPVISIRHFLDLHNEFAFNSIRKANHPNADNLISYIYEVQTIQNKIALSLHEYVRLLDYVEKNKKEALLINAEVDAMMRAEHIFSYLKASIEKIVVVIGLMFNIKNLESKKTHKEKIAALAKQIPEEIKEAYYYDFISEFISSENLQELNNYRTGILHKRGIADLQPHKYNGEKSEDLPLRKILEILMLQHSKNTAVLIGVYALLTDELVKLDPPDVRPFDIPLPEKFSVI